MQILRYGPQDAPALLFVHDLGLGPWMWKPMLARFGNAYQILTAAIGGHPPWEESPFAGIEQEAITALEQCDALCGGRVKALCGTGLGAQIALTMLCLRPALADCALLESVSIVPLESAAERMGLPLLYYRPFCRMEGLLRQAAQSWQLDDEQMRQYLQGAARFSPAPLRKAYASYALWDAFADCTARVLALCGRRQRLNILRSAGILAAMARHGQLELIDECETALSLFSPGAYAIRLEELLGSLPSAGEIYEESHDQKMVDNASKIEYI
ncbi:MAG: alpha/beta hydrolase [Eubacteriales bacterium]|nr:alpha/beta hydrolase [Eubacteriales bacterium]